jgi:hypothetical protein
MAAGTIGGYRHSRHGQRRGSPPVETFDISPAILIVLLPHRSLSVFRCEPGWPNLIKTEMHDVACVQEVG